MPARTGPKPAPNTTPAPAPRAPSRAGGGPKLETFEDAVAFLLDRVNVERSSPGKVDPHAFKLERTVALMEALGNPHTSFRSIHVAGSKGKGSVCEMAAASLQACGLTTGLYTSPHLTDIRERVRIDGRPIPHADFRLLAEKIASVLPRFQKAWGAPTFFELITALGFLHFAEQAVDIAVVEVGLGGRLDSTNVVTPLVSVITEIQLEHTDLLGATHEAIALEKAGIVKPGVPVLTLEQREPAALDAIRRTAQSRGSPLLVLGQDLDFSARVGPSSGHGPEARVCLSTPHSNFEHIIVPLRGEHQAANCGLVLGVLDQLRHHGYAITERDVVRGLAQTPGHGRMELVHASPRVFVDGAHNPESVAALLKSLATHVRYDSLVVVFGCAKDKDVAGMLRRLSAGADKVIFTRADNNPRAMEPRDLARKYIEISGRPAQVAPDLRHAISLAQSAVAREDVICVTGSFYLAGEAKRLFHPAPSALEIKPLEVARPR